MHNNNNSRTFVQKKVLYARLRQVLTLYLLVSSADNLCKQLDPDQARQNVGPDLDPNCLTL